MPNIFSYNLNVQELRTPFVNPLIHHFVFLQATSGLIHCKVRLENFGLETFPTVVAFAEIQYALQSYRAQPLRRNIEFHTTMTVRQERRRSWLMIDTAEQHCTGNADDGKLGRCYKLDTYQ